MINMDSRRFEDMPEHEQRRNGAALLAVLMQIRNNPDQWEKVQQRAAENERRRT